VDSAALNGAHGRWDVAMSRDENDRGVGIAGKLLLELEAVDVRQLHVENQASREVGLRRCDIVRGDGERLRPPTQGLQQLAERLAHPGVIVYNEDDLVTRGHDASFAANGSVKATVAPRVL